MANIDEWWVPADAGEECDCWSCDECHERIAAAEETAAERAAWAAEYDAGGEP